MESNVVEVQFLYAPRVSQYSIIVDTGDEQTQMGLEELKAKYPMLCDGLSQMFSVKPDNPDYPWDLEGDWQCGGGTLHPATQPSCDCLEMNEEICRSQMEYEYELADKPTAISEEDELKMQILREKIANQ